MASPILLRNSEVFDLDELNHPPRSHRIIGPATTPDIHPHHPHHHLNSAVNINSDGLRFRRASLISALNHVKRSQGAAADQDQDYDESEADYIVNEEMRNWGWLLLVLSSVSFVLGVWSIILGPFIDTTAIPVSLPVDVARRLMCLPRSVVV